MPKMVTYFYNFRNYMARTEIIQELSVELAVNFGIRSNRRIGLVSETSLVVS